MILLMIGAAASFLQSHSSIALMTAALTSRDLSLSSMASIQASNAALTLSQTPFSIGFLHQVLQTGTKVLVCKVESKTMLCIVFEQGVRPRRAMAVLIGRIRHGGSGSAPDRGAACCVGDDHAITEQLGDQLRIRGLTAACAGSGEFEIRHLELAAFDGGFVHRICLDRYGL